ncbi:MAG: Maf family nucleotide pyrophosphatase [Erysipelotrichaceae bacterium]|nr:Maf family nucleotide pyrophosphatase [Erysipelotrichaceae bacterium]MDD3809748.1 Maf family nucleotide pyrophosphatase [Erysipelotrichaceae bacterium]
MEIILGSASPRRKELLGLLGYPFTVVVREVDETITGGDFGQIAMDIARKKAEAFIDDTDSHKLFICADTVVVAKGEILTKPKDKADAARMLKILSGKVHEVYSGVAILHRGQIFSFFEKTAVEFVRLTSQEIDDYIATGEPFDKAGAYGIQGFGARFVKRIEGDYYNVVGLPICQLNIHLKDILADNCTYMLRCGDSSLYTGWTNDIEKRLKSHNSHKASKYTRAKAPVELVYLEIAFNKSQALKREVAIKKLRRPQKEQLAITGQLDLIDCDDSSREVMAHFTLDWIKVEQLVQRTGLDQAQIESRLERAIDEGRIEREGDSFRFNFQKNILDYHRSKKENDLKR